MRTNKELFELALQNPIHFTYGICGWFLSMRNYRIITHDEFRQINSYIEKERPKKYTFGTLDVYSWPPGLKKPRVNWINKQVKKLGNDENNKRTTETNT